MVLSSKMANVTVSSLAFSNKIVFVNICSFVVVGRRFYAKVAIV